MYTNKRLLINLSELNNLPIFKDLTDSMLFENVLKNFGRTSVSENTKIEFEFLETDKGRQVSIIYNILNSEIIKNPKIFTD